MTSYKKKSILLTALSAVFIVMAWLCRYLSVMDVIGNPPADLIRRIIHNILLIFWAFSLNKRIVNRQAKRYLLLIAFLIFFWITVRSVKYDLPYEMHTLTRYLWYCFYIPMLFIPLIGLFFTGYLGKPSNYRAPKQIGLLYIPTFLLLMLVMTNDLHQLVFVNPYDRYDYTYGIGYYFVIGWIFILSFLFLGALFHGSRLPNRGKRIFLPFLFVLSAFVYSLFYMFCFDQMKPFMGDMTTVFCIQIALIVESCIQTGLIPSNTCYVGLLHAASVSAMITDEKFQTFKVSGNAISIPAQTMKKAASAAVMIDSRTRLSSAKIKGGYVFWTTDVSELSEVIAKLEELNEDLKDRHFVLQEEYDTRHKKQSLEEKNRLYNEMQNQTKAHLELLVQLTDAIEKSKDTEATKQFVAKAAVVSAYLKRRNNLIFISEEIGDVPANELELCLKESMLNIKLSGKICEMKSNLSGKLTFRQITAAYDAFEQAVEFFMDDFEELFVAINGDNGSLTVCIHLVSALDITPLQGAGFRIEKEDEHEWQLEGSFPKGCDAV